MTPHPRPAMAKTCPLGEILDVCWPGHRKEIPENRLKEVSRGGSEQLIPSDGVGVRNTGRIATGGVV